MTVYDVTIFVDDDDAPGLVPTTDAVYDAMRRLGCREGHLEVEVKGPPELRIGAIRE